MSARSTWILRVATAAGCFALAVGSTSSGVASERPSPPSPATLSSGVTPQGNSAFGAAARFRNAETISRMFAAAESTGSPFEPPGHGGVNPGRHGDDPHPGGTHGKPADRPPAHANNDKDKGKGK